MKYLCNSKIFLAIAIAFVCLTAPAFSLDARVLTITDKTASLDLGPGFQMEPLGKIDANTSGMVYSNVVINSTDSPGVALLSILSLYDQTMMKLRPEVLSEMFLVGVSSKFEESGDTYIGNWSTTSSLGKEVNVYEMATNDTESVGATSDNGHYYIACWNLDSSVYAIIVSGLGENSTKQAIGTLVVR